MYIFLCKIVSQVATYITSLNIQFLLNAIQICLQMKEILNEKFQPIKSAYMFWWL